MHEPQEAQIAGSGPKSTSFYSVEEGEVEVVAESLFVIGPEHPAGGLIEREHGTILVENGYSRAVR